MARNKDIFSHSREGKTQNKRFLTELNPANLELNDFDIADWILFVFNFAKHINFFEKSDIVNGDWQSFFDIFEFDTTNIPFKGTREYNKWIKEIELKLENFKIEGDLPPHLTLFVCFIQLLELSKKRFNNLTKRHLDFYYNEILNLHKNPITEDSVYVVFGLAKKALQEVVPLDTQLDAGRDTNGKKIIYNTNEEIVVNETQVVALKSVLNVDDDTNQFLKASPIANSLDGLGEELPEDNRFWWPFGYSDEIATGSSAGFKALKEGVLGFSVASPVLELHEGTRNVSVSLRFSNSSAIVNLTNDEKAALQNSIKVQYSGEEDWISDVELQEIRTTSSNNIQLNFNVPDTLPAIAIFNKEVLTGGFDTKYPVIRFLLEGETSYEAYRILGDKNVVDVNVSVSVTELKSIETANDNGTINAKKPFYPFTIQPNKGANFFIDVPELENKNWDTITTKIYWKNTPASFKELYKAYNIENEDKVTRKNFNTSKNLYSIVTNDSYFKANVSVNKDNKWIQKNSNQVLFTKQGSEYITSVKLNANGQLFSNKLKLSLNQSFLQEVYPTIYTLALLSEEKDNIIPSQAYVPFIEKVEISYSASENINNNVTLYQEDVFGHRKVTNFNDESVVPTHDVGGEFYIGLSATPGEQVSLLIKTLEGSENPLAETFEGEETINWQILSDNEWLSLSDEIVFNQTDNLLKSGILRFNIPKTTSLNNTLLPKDTVWIRAINTKSFDAVCKIENVFTQATVATFKNDNNEVAHLENGLPNGTIEKMITRIPKVKTVQQPYESFGGVVQETDTQFYRRISERLRHKGRAITQWDYEQLILQKFPEVFNVKCLNHTSDTSFEAPGNITLIVIPNTQLKNSFDIYQPRVSRSRLSEITSFVKSKTSLHVVTRVENPEYEELEVTVSVKFRKEFDAKFYANELDLDLKKYLSPWAFDTGKDLSYDLKISKNMIVNYIEKLRYVDNIQKIEIRKGVDGANKIVQTDPLITSTPRSIIVSAKQHYVTIL